LTYSEQEALSADQRAAWKAKQEDLVVTLGRILTPDLGVTFRKFTPNPDHFPPGPSKRVPRSSDVCL
jgi:hypothetical protein